MKLSITLVAVILGFSSCVQVSSKESQPFNVDTLHNVDKTNIPYNQRQPPVLFVQWQYPSTTTGLQALEVRQDVETEIDNALQKGGAGQWFAGDLGPGGANMLFEVNNKEKALEIIQYILTKKGIHNETVIAERVYTAPDDWTHKVIYPKDYEGDFNDM